MTPGFQCLLCANDGAPGIVQSEVTGDPNGMLRAVQCLSCSHVQLSPPSYDLDYRDDGQVNFVTSHYGTPIETLLEHSAIEARRRLARFAISGEPLVRGDGRRVRLLDIGGGYGFFGLAVTRAARRSKRRLEPSAEGRAETGRRHFAERADPAFPAPSFAIGLLDDAFLERHGRRFDIVTLWHVLEHVADPLTLMADALRARPPGRRGLWIEVPNVDDELAGLSPAYRRMKLHARTYLLFLRRRAGADGAPPVPGCRRRSDRLSALRHLQLFPLDPLQRAARGEAGYVGSGSLVAGDALVNRRARPRGPATPCC